ncbi:hypothetical protein BDP27DRAFT_651230 [Rhodocollybia butyracea]|uniref:Uncharacterized protein n=1 Tax=Rhodocollybia butyracea TaxID=206335 RepID=A0A9P5P751_9AGAR|nr:hypothetical protein BDP27DRAFT_651230 [Rhodocollybia butyracea]
MMYPQIATFTFLRLSRHWFLCYILRLFNPHIAPIPGAPSPSFTIVHRVTSPPMKIRAFLFTTTSDFDSRPTFVFFFRSRHFCEPFLSWNSFVLLYPADFPSSILSYRVSFIKFMAHLYIYWFELFVFSLVVIVVLLSATNSNVLRLSVCTVVCNFRF